MDSSTTTTSTLAHTNPAPPNASTGIYLHPISHSFSLTPVALPYPAPASTHTRASTTTTTASRTATENSNSASTTSSTFGLPNHYAILQLTPRATTAEIKDAYRRLRAEYFRSDPLKYRALQAAFDVLVDVEARGKYDGLMGNMGRGVQESDHKDNGTETSKPHARSHHITPTISDPPTTKTTSSSSFDTNPSSNSLGFAHSTFASASGSNQSHSSSSTSSSNKHKPHDPNRALKSHNFLATQKYALIGTAPYPSFIPIAEVYEGRDRHPVLACGRPKYVLRMARLAMP
ncbi:hypothetical protein M011DRAFT_475941 [Sporormia fimetaria CBS 119925]|uniref:J domain-containing protein n=1 Tax=Sporormia fimetaria CBS 119925 TaxID=1340428 RepID=A0A6A6VI51_9PLEO|nr:hypothetical protein M011DRAFT_475941 [Sporormia fimetaria CBS 119925]